MSTIINRKFINLFISILIAFHSNTANGKKTVKLIFGGDVTFGGITRYLVDHGKCTYNQSFRHVKPHFKDADFVLVNLETVFRVNDGDWLKPPPNKGIHLVSDGSSISALKYAGITDVSLANNHVNDLGARGVIKTLKHLKNHNIGYLGITHGKSEGTRQKPLILEKNGIKIGIIGYCDVILLYERLEESIGAAPFNVTNIQLLRDEADQLRKDGADVVILFMHWCGEYTCVMDTPELTVVKELVKRTTVDIIIGSHPHTTHQHFYANKTLVASSLGNFLFPSHYSCSRNFEIDDRNITNINRYVNVWQKQSRFIPNPTSFGKVMKIEVDKNGVIPSKTKYMLTQIVPEKKHNCLEVIQKPGTKWRKVCGKNDPECMAVDGCNVLDCDGTDAFVDIVV